MHFPPLFPAPADIAVQFRNALSGARAGDDFTDEEVESIYASAYEYAQAGRNDDALAHAVVAALYRPSEPRYLHAAAVLLGQVGRHEDALKVYRVLDLIEPCTPRNVLGMAECALGLKQFDKAIDFVEQVIEHCEDFDKPGPALDKARSIHKLLTRKEQHVH